MDNLKPFLLLAFAVADGSFLHGMLSGLHLPTNEEGWGTTLGAALLLIASQVLQGHMTARKWRKFMQKNMVPKASTPTVSQS
jgi:hypothetical protein